MRKQPKNVISSIRHMIICMPIPIMGIFGFHLRANTFLYLLCCFDCSVHFTKTTDKVLLSNSICSVPSLFFFFFHWNIRNVHRKSDSLTIYKCIWYVRLFVKCTYHYARDDDMNQRITVMYASTSALHNSVINFNNLGCIDSTTTSTEIAPAATIHILKSGCNKKVVHCWPFSVLSKWPFITYKFANKVWFLLLLKTF